MLYSATSADPQQGLYRRRCRNPLCRSKLTSPTFDRLSAFCCTRCCDNFFRTRCVVCESPISRKTHGQRVCRRPKCRSEFKRHREQFLGTRYPSRGVADISGKKLVKSRVQPVINWGLDPELAARHARERAVAIAERNRRRPVPTPLIGPHDPPVNILGGYQFPNAPKVGLPISTSAARSALSTVAATIPADLSIPELLRRTVGNA
jgi:hypothetical protein